MRKFVKMAAVAAWVLLAVAGCNRHKFVKATYEEYMMVPMMDSSADSLDIQISLEYPVSGVEDTVKAKIIENLLFAAFDVNYNLPSVDSTAVHYRNDLIEEYQQEQEDYANFIGDNNIVMEGNLFSWRDYVNGYFTGEEYKGLLTYVVELERDRGGAHPNNTVNATVFNRATGDVVVEADLFNEGYESTLSELLGNHLSDALEGDEDALQAVYPDVLAANGNFEVGKEGITFYYNPNEIAPPILGVIAIRIPWSELSDILKI
jgi:hypothetical protein